MLGNVLPGLRELRAPLAAGYLWLLFAWLAWGDKLPGKGEKKADPLERLYQLEPVISSLGLAVVASVAAYTVGSIVIDLQSAMGRRVADRFSRVIAAWKAARPRPIESVRAPTARVGRLALTDAGSSMLERWESARADELRDEFRVPDDQAEARARELPDVEAEERALGDAKSELAAAREPFTAQPVYPRSFQERARDVTRFDRARSDRVDLNKLQLVCEDQQRVVVAARDVRSALTFPPDREIREATREYIASNRDLLKTRLLDASQPLHSDLDRPDAEATFRMALWPPVAVLVIYLALEVSAWWWFALVVPLLLAWQWISLRRKANDALVAAFVARDELGGEPARAEVRKGTVRRITEQLKQFNRKDDDYEPPQFLLEYLETDSGARASGGQSKPPDESNSRTNRNSRTSRNQPGESHQPESPPDEAEPSAEQSEG